MKKLVLVRHAKAVDRAENIGDFERSLVKKGRKNAREMANRLRATGFQPDYFISSSANRALETAHIFAELFAYPIQKILIRDSIYESSSMEPFLYLINELDSSINNVILFGHNPSLSELADTLLGGLKKSMPKSAVVEIAFEKENWNDIKPGEGRLANFDYPKNKGNGKMDGKLFLQEIRNKVSEDIKGRLAAVDSDAAESIADKIDRSARKIVSKFAKKSGIAESK